MKETDVAMKNGEQMHWEMVNSSRHGDQLFETKEFKWIWSADTGTTKSVGLCWVPAANISQPCCQQNWGNLMITCGGFHKWGYPCSSSIFVSDFPSQKSSSVFGVPHNEVETSMGHSQSALWSFWLDPNLGCTGTGHGARREAAGAVGNRPWCLRKTRIHRFIFPHETSIFVADSPSCNAWYTGGYGSTVFDPNE